MSVDSFRWQTGSQLLARPEVQGSLRHIRRPRMVCLNTSFPPDLMDAASLLRRSLSRRCFHNAAARLVSSGLIALAPIVVQPVFADAPTCQGQIATIYVESGLIVGGPDDGQTYEGTLNGTSGNDVIAGTAGQTRVAEVPAWMH